MPPKALMLAATASGSGKTLLTLSILRLMRQNGIRIAGAKVGPDYIDPAFHAKASGRPSYNLDPWAMSPQTLNRIFRDVLSAADGLLIEGVMGLFDGGNSSCATLAKHFKIPILLLLNVKGQAETALAVMRGMVQQDPALEIKGVVLNNVASARHEEMIRNVWQKGDPPIIGAIPRLDRLRIADRHLGLVQAREFAEIDIWLDKAAEAIAPHLDMDSFLALFGGVAVPSSSQTGKPIPLLPVTRLAIAEDDAFSFLYPHLKDAWRKAGTELSFFSPLLDQAPADDAEAIYLPGGYPELYAGKLAANRGFSSAMRKAAEAGKMIYGECGGYMVLGEAIIDKDEQTHQMLGLLPLVSEFSEARLHLGYREVEMTEHSPLAYAGEKWRGHEFHYARIKTEGEGEALFHAWNREGRSLGKIGRRRGRIMGSFFHFIDEAS